MVHFVFFTLAVLFRSFCDFSFWTMMKSLRQITKSEVAAKACWDTWWDRVTNS